MKRIALLILLFLPFLLKAQDSKWLLYPSLGIDMGGAIPFPFSDIPDGAKGTPKLNPSLGLGFEYRVATKWNLGFEVSYHLLAFSANADVISQPFYSDDHQNVLYFSGHAKTDVELRVLEFPVVAVYDLNHRWSLLMGVYYSRILEGSFKTEGTKGVLSDDKTITDSAQLPGVANTDYNFNDYLDKWDAGLLIGYRYNIINRVYFWSNLNVGFNSIFKSDFDNIDYEMYQVRLNVGVSISLFN
jgi:hypothetical protein